MGVSLTTGGNVPLSKEAPVLAAAGPAGIAADFGLGV